MEELDKVEAEYLKRILKIATTELDAFLSNESQDMIASEGITNNATSNNLDNNSDDGGANNDFNNEPSAKSINGGPGSGNFGHAGRPGEVGGSAPTGSSSADYGWPITPEERQRMLERLRKDELITKMRRMRGISSFDEAHVKAMQEAGFTDEQIQKWKEKILAKQLVNVEAKERKAEIRDKIKDSPEQKAAIDNIVSKVKMEKKDETWLRNNCDTEMAQAFSDEVDKANEMGIKNIRLTLNDSKATNGRMGYIASRDEYELTLTKGILRDTEIVKQQRQATGPDGSRFKTSSEINGTFAHEFGHAMETQFLKSYVKDKSISKSSADISRLRISVSNYVTSEAMKNLSKQGISVNELAMNTGYKYMSKYGTTNAGETIAESFANPNYSSFTKEVYDLVSGKKALSNETQKNIEYMIQNAEKRYKEFH